MHHLHHGEPDPTARDFGRDGVSGLVNLDRAMRARDVSRPGEQEYAEAAKIMDSLIARINGTHR